MRELTSPTVLWVAVASIVSGSLSADTPPQPYAGQENREIKALSAEELDGYLKGEGMGLAKAAELNGFPGPLHVLELAEELQLTEEQSLRTREIFDEMREQARRLGARLVDKERELDRLFASEAVTEPELEALIREIGGLQAELRATHLRAHLAQRAVLTEHQVMHYKTLRGYGSGGAGGHDHDPSGYGHPSRHPW